MAQPGDVIEVPALAIRIEFRATHASTGGAYTEVDVVGRPRGFIRVAHVHVGVTEHHTVIAGAMRVKLHGKTHILGPGDELVIPPDTPHQQHPAGREEGRIRIRLTPSARSDEFFERLGELDYNRLGFPQARLRRALRRRAGRRRSRCPPQPEDPAARRPRRARAGEPRVRVRRRVGRRRGAARPSSTRSPTAPPTPPGGSRSTSTPSHDGELTHQHFKGRLPYHLHTRTRTTVSERPHTLQGETEGDLRGTGIWTLTENADGGTHVRFDWRVHADRPLLKLLTPLLRPVLRWNHDWAIARAIEGLEPYVRERGRVRAPISGSPRR